MPSHNCYIEPFTGGAAVLFAKRPVRIEIINDTNLNVVSFWRELRDNKQELIEKLAMTPYARHEFDLQKKVFDSNEGHTQLERAIAFFVTCNQSFSATGQSFGQSTEFNRKQTMTGKIKDIVFNLKNRFRNVQIENMDAFKLIKKIDSRKNGMPFFYIDPPYVDCTSSNIYKSWSLDKMNELLELLKTIKSKFILSTYPNDGFKLDPKWRIKSNNVRKTSAVRHHYQYEDELIIMNY